MSTDGSYSNALIYLYNRAAEDAAKTGDWTQANECLGDLMDYNLKHSYGQ